MKKAIIFDPYLDTLGGGERYSFTFANELQKYGYKVEIAWDKSQTIKDAEDRFGMDLSKIKINKNAFKLFQVRSSVIKRFLFTLKYGLVFWVSDGSLPFLFSRNNLVHFQVPFKTIGGNSVVNKLKNIFIHKFVYNSLFTATVHETHFPKNKSFVLYPPIDVQSFKSRNKENIILSVGRFDSPSHSKRQDILIDAFKVLHKSNPSFELFLAGGNFGDSDILEKLKEKAGTLPIKFIVNPSFDKLKNLYEKSKFFWHATGFEVDEKIDPEKVEHFGMTTVEAMASGCIPIVIAKGGQKEIITKNVGVLVDSPEEMANETILLIKKPSILDDMSQSAQKRSQDFSITEFDKKIKTIL